MGSFSACRGMDRGASLTDKPFGKHEIRLKTSLRKGLLKFSADLAYLLWFMSSVVVHKFVTLCRRLLSGLLDSQNTQAESKERVPLQMPKFAMVAAVINRRILEIGTLSCAAMKAEIWNETH